jgi:hypothetical protein
MDILMRQKRNKSIDSMNVGLLAGFLVPILIFLAVWLFEKKDLPFDTYIENLWHLRALVKLGSLCIFANILTFMAFIRLKYDRSARGVLGATILYALAILISKAF